MVAMLFVCFLVCLFGGSQSAVVQPSPCSSSPHNAADSLDAYLAEWALRRSDVMELQLASGEHCIRNFSLVRDLEDRSLVANGSAVIKCAPGVGVAFYNMTRLTLANIVLDGCGLKLDLIRDFLSVVAADIDIFLNVTNNSDQYIAMAMGNCRDLVMENTSIMNTMGLGLLAINLVGHSQLTNVRLEHNVPAGCFQPALFTTQDLNTDKIGGGAVFAYHDYISSSSETTATLTITNATVHANSYCGYSSLYNVYSFYTGGRLERLLGGGGGLSLIFPQLQYKVSATLIDSIFTNNTGIYGGGAFLVFYTGVYDSKVLLQGCQFESNGLDPSLATDISYPLIGSALSLFTDFIQPDFQVSKITQSSPTTVHVVDSSFINNTAFTGVVAFFSLYNLVTPDDDGTELQFDITRCIFQGNLAANGPVVYANEYKSSSLQRGINFTMQDVQIIENTVASQITTAEVSGVLHLKQINFTLAGNSSLRHNVGSALKAMSSLVTLQGNISFHNNTAAYGGAMNLVGETVMELTANTTVSFTKNTGAVAGGAIYVQFTSSSTQFQYEDCFLYFSDGLLCQLFGGDFCDDITKIGVTIRFEGNIALLGGMIYGSTLHTCPWAIQFMQTYAPGITFADKRLFEILYEERNFTSPFRFDRLPVDTAAVSTPILNLSASSVNSTLNTSITRLTVAPGIDEPIELAARDAFGQLSPAVVSSRSSTSTATSVLGSNYVFIDYNSTQVTSISVTSSDAMFENDTAVVSIFTIGSFSEFVLNVSFSSCPGGFYLNSTYNNCTCPEDLNRYHVTCTGEGKLIVPVNTWLGVYRRGVQVVGCSFDFCSRLVRVFKVDIDEIPFEGRCQESYNRSGPGCGSCATNYSAVFGSNRCLRCSNIYVLLLLVFAVLGILLMVILLNLRISIAGGFLNGVLFFSNIVSLYAPLYAPSFYSGFLLFSWFSLKFGIESCFFDGMRPLDIAVLNFIFPLYLYFLVLVIVLLARRSSKFAQWLFKTKSSPSQLFATILVMTYSSLLESCLQAISFTPLHIVNPNGTITEYRWRLDPSVKYFHGGHGALGVLAIILLVFFIIPAPILWMFPARLLTNRVLRRYKPVYDAVWAPLKPRYIFWVSLRLLFRIPPLLFFSFIPVPENLVFLTMFLLVILYIQGMVQPFEGTAQNVFDNFLQLLLLIITISSLYFTLLQPSDTDENIEHLNKEVNRIYNVQLSVLYFLLFVAHLTLYIIFAKHLLVTFPRLKRRLGIIWNKLVVCQKCRVYVPQNSPSAHRRNTVIVQPENLSVSYQTPEIDNAANPATNTATFSELREPLLEETI